MKFFIIVAISLSLIFKTDSLKAFNNRIFLYQTRECFRSKSKKDCTKALLRLESLQNISFEKGNYKCQTKLIGLQSEIIRLIKFNRNKFFIDNHITRIEKICF